jgi:hypothetical protein
MNSNTPNTDPNRWIEGYPKKRQPGDRFECNLRNGLLVTVTTNEQGELDLDDRYSISMSCAVSSIFYKQVCVVDIVRHRLIERLVEEKKGDV